MAGAFGRNEAFLENSSCRYKGYASVLGAGLGGHVGGTGELAIGTYRASTSFTAVITQRRPLTPT